MKDFHESKRVASPTYHFTVVFSIMVFVVILTMSYLFKIEIVAQGIGKVIPTGRVQTVQPEFGGQIEEIRVRDGSFVSKGDTLVRLDPTNAKAQVNTLNDEISRLEVELLRIQTLTKWVHDATSVTPVKISEIVTAFGKISNSPDADFLLDQEQLLAAELTELADSLSRLDARIEANRRSEAVTRSNISRIDASIETQEERFSTAQSLLEKGSMSRAKYLNVLDGLNRLQNERAVYLSELEQKSAVELSYSAEKTSIVSSQRSRVINRKSQITGVLHELKQRLTTAKRREYNSVLRAPISGTVDQLTVYTIGGIVSGGQELMRIVPDEERFEVEAVFLNRDVGFMEEGQVANIKLDAFPSERFGVLKGRISHVSADAVEISPEVFGFKIGVQPDTPYLETSATKYPLRSGMTTQVDIITGERRLISFFFAPIVKVLQESLGER